MTLGKPEQSEVQMGQHRFHATQMSGLRWPGNLYLPMVRNAVAEIRIDKALVRNLSLSCHPLEISNNLFEKAHPHRRLELRLVRIPA